MTDSENLNYLLFITMAFLFLSCSNDMRDVMKFPSMKITPSQSADSVEFIMADSTELRVVLKAPRVLIFSENVSEPFTILPKGVKVFFFGDDEDNRANTELCAQYAVRYEWSRKTDLKNNVVVKNYKGEILRTDHLVWDENLRKISTTDYVEIITANRKLIGYGLESNDDFTRYSIQNIQAEILFEEEQKEDEN